MEESLFSYRQFRVGDDRKTVYFDYALRHKGQEHEFAETIEFPVELPDVPELKRALRALHLALGVSYYKIFVPPVIEHPYAMDEAEAGFWNDVWLNGLGEFLYVNKLPAERLAKFTAQDGEKFEGESSSEASGALLGIGGGKDSIVAGELLKALDVPASGFVMATGEQAGQAQAVAKTMGVELHIVKRTIDKKLLEVQEQPGTYRGHVPISLAFSLVGTTLAVANKAAYVVVANEAGTSLPRGIRWEGREVNHQWSKSFEAEQLIQNFIKTNVSASVTYFSAIRQLTSVGVAKIFAKFPQYFEVFTSDNFVFRIDPSKRPSGRWSLESPKSLSSYLLLAPWLSDEDLKRTFGIDFLNEHSLKDLFLALTGQEGEPPLDCVGTTEELELSINLLDEQGRYQDTYLMQLAKERGIVRADELDWQAELADFLRLQPQEALPPELKGQIQAWLEKELGPTT
ncbi:hypothetical protein IRY61_02380 [Candidatus Saccharibacteria bacterium]|nr:hypothetical protein [Candidatus Saccharibacteria bacterium]